MRVLFLNVFLQTGKHGLNDRFQAYRSELDALLADVDALTFAVPPDVQAELAVRAAEAGRHRTGAGAHRLRPTDGGSRGSKVRRREVVIPLTQKPPLDPQWRDHAFEMLSMANSQLWLQTLRTGVIWLGPNPSPGSLSHRAHGTFNRSTRHEFRYLPRPSRRTHVTPPSASDTGGDSAAAIDTN